MQSLPLIGSVGENPKEHPELRSPERVILGMKPHPSCPRPLFLIRLPSWAEMLTERASAPDRTLD